MSSYTYKVKSYGETRKFRLAADVTLRGLRAAITERMRAVLPPCWDLEYVDEDGDRITIKEDDELQDARECSSKLVLFVKAASGTEGKARVKRPTAVPEKPTHAERPAGARIPDRSRYFSVWVGGLPQMVTESQLRTLFKTRFSSVAGAAIIRDRAGISRGFGFVDFLSIEERNASVSVFHNYLYLNKKLRVQTTTPERRFPEGIHSRSPSPGRRAPQTTTHAEYAQSAAGGRESLGPGTNLALWDAARRSDVGEVKRLLGLKADVNWSNKDNDGYTPLIIASVKGLTEMAELLLNHRANINKCSSNGYAPLNCASGNGHTQTVCRLIARNADLETKNQKGQTPLICASIKGHVDCIRALVSASADLNSVAGTAGHTALIYAAAFNVMPAVRVLVEAGADLELRGDDQTAVEWAIQRGHNEIVRFLTYDAPRLQSATRPAPPPDVKVVSGPWMSADNISGAVRDESEIHVEVGQELVASWALLNSGSANWASNLSLAQISGTLNAREPGRPQLPPLPPNAMVHLRRMFGVAARAGRQDARFRLTDGVRMFGPVLCAAFVVRTAGSVLPATRAAPKETYPQANAQLVDMKFTDVELNQALLRFSGGNLSGCVEWLTANEKQLAPARANVEAKAKSAARLAKQLYDSGRCADAIKQYELAYGAYKELDNRWGQYSVLVDLIPALRQQGHRERAHQMQLEAETHSRRLFNNNS